MARNRAKRNKHSPNTLFIDCLRSCLGLRRLYGGPPDDEYGCLRHLVGQYLGDGNRRIEALPQSDDRYGIGSFLEERHKRHRLDFQEYWDTRTPKPTDGSLRGLVYGKRPRKGAALMTTRPRIQTGNDFPGLQNGLAYSPHTGGPITRLVETLLHSDDGALSRGEREFAMAAACLTTRNSFCYRVHSQVAALLLPEGEDVIQILSNQALDDEHALPSKLRAIAGLAFKVVRGSLNNGTVSHYLDECWSHGLSNQNVHDIMLIASTSLMLNAYVDALNAPYPDNPAFFRQLAQHFVKNGYLSDAERARG